MVRFFAAWSNAMAASSAELRPIERDCERAFARPSPAGGADIVLLAGGTGHGADDFAAEALAEAGELAIHGVAMRPSSPAGGAGAASAMRLFFSFPAIPVSCLCAYDFFAGRAGSGSAAGRGPAIGRTERGPGRRRPQDRLRDRKVVDYCRGAHRQRREVEPLALSGASVLSGRRRGPTASLSFPPKVKGMARARRSPSTFTTERASGAEFNPRPPMRLARQEQFLTVITRDEATERFRRHSARAARPSNGAAGRR